jgi:predicted transcriptional regulator of viral defense system
MDAEISQHQSLLEAARQVPNGVVTLLSALAFHEFTTQNPSVIWMAIDGKARTPRVSYPPIRFIKMSTPFMSEGVEEHIIQGVTIKVFSPAKTVADCFKFRNKIGLDVALEALKEGWRGKKFKRPELLHYAESCRVKKIMMPYVEAVV